MWGEAPPRKPSFQASKLPNFLIVLLAQDSGAWEGVRPCARRQLPTFSAKVAFCGSFVFPEHDTFPPDKIEKTLTYYGGGATL